MLATTCCSQDRTNATTEQPSTSHASVTLSVYCQHPQTLLMTDG